MLRNQITPAAANSTPSSGKNTTNTTPTTTTTTTPASTQLLHQLTGLLMCRNIEDMRTRANWVGVAGGSRLHVLTEIQGNKKGRKK